LTLAPIEQPLYVWFEYVRGVPTGAVWLSADLAVVGYHPLPGCPLEHAHRRADGLNTACRSLGGPRAAFLHWWRLAREPGLYAAVTGDGASGIMLVSSASALAAVVPPLGYMPEAEHEIEPMPPEMAAAIAEAQTVPAP
jgi:hypothetical protein